MRLTTRLLLLMAGLALASALIVVLPGRTLDQQIQRERSISELYDAAGRAADAWLALKSELTATLAAGAGAQPVQQLAAGAYPARSAEARGLLDALSRAYDTDARIELLDASGRVLLSEGALNIPDSPAAQAFWQDPESGPGSWLRALEPRLAWTTFEDRYDSRDTPDVSGRQLRIVAGARLVRLGQSRAASGGGTLGYLLVHVPTTALQRSQSLGAAQGISVSYRWQASGAALLTGTADPPRAVLANLATEPTGADSRDRGDGSTRAVALADWLGVRRPADETLSVVAWRAQAPLAGLATVAGRDMTIIALIAVVLMIVVLLATLYRNVIRPVLQINEAAIAVAGGDLNVAVDHRRSDEIGQLASSFNKMVGNLRRSMVKVQDLSFTDTLTGLPNRRLFNELFSAQLEYGRIEEQRQALLFLDLDEFKRVNDSFGHKAGDDLLIEVAERLVDCMLDQGAMIDGPDDQERRPRMADMRDAVSEAGVVARLGGDEFLMLLKNPDTPKRAGQLAERILKALQVPVEIDGEPIYASASIGIAMFPDDGLDQGALLHHADKAMYEAKSVGKKTYKYYADVIEVSAADQLRVQSRLRAALNEDALKLVLHPMFRAQDGAACQAEALMRWEDPKLGHVPPATFIPVAESSGDITLLTEWAINQVAEMLGRWHTRLPPGYRISVNVSAIDVQRTDLAGIVRRALDHHGAPPAQMVIELTETGLLSPGARPEAVIRSLKNEGVGVALDDFGTGYSSLGYLHRFPIDELKLDQSFVKPLGKPGNNESLVAAVAALARGLSLETVAEGVESPEAIARLRALGYDILQGYLFTTPLEESRFVQEFDRDPLVHRWMHYWIDEQT